MKRMLLVWGCIFALGFLSCGSDDNDDDDNISILVNGAETVSAVEAGQSVLLRLSNGVPAAWSVSDTSVATLSATTGVSVNLAAQAAGSVTVTATAGGRHYIRALQITAQSSDPNGGTANAPNVTFINLSAYKVVVCRDGLSAELTTVAPGATKSVYVAPGTTEITFHFRYSYCVLDGTDSGMVWLDVADSTAYTYPVDSADIASDTVQVRIPAPKNPQFNAAYLKVANQSDAPISLYNGNTQQKVYGQEKYYIQPGHSGVYAIPPDAPFDGFRLGATPTSATPVAPFYAVSGTLYACVFSADDDSVTATEENWLRESFTVSFETNGGSAIPPLTASLLEATLIPATTREGYYFAGWHTDPELQRAATFPRVMTADTTLYAKWLENTNTAYTVRHFLQNTDRSTYMLKDTEPQTGTTEAATIAAAKTYRGFTARPFAQETIAADGTTVIDIYYDRNAYTVTFDANNGTGHTQTQTYYYGVPQPLKPNTFTNPDYTFIGWAVSATDNPVYDNQADLLIDGDTPSGITLYAAWFYTVTAATAGSMDLASIQPDTYTIKVKGSITQDTLAVLADKMKSSTAASITLDMTEATGLTAITGNGYTSLFANCPLNSVALPNTLETIGDFAFAQCGITSVTIPASVKTIGEKAFCYCSNLQSAEIDGAETIGASAFINCKSLSSITINAEIIDSNTFYGCTSLTVVYIGNRVIKINNSAFYDCRNLKEVHFVDTEKRWRYYDYNSRIYIHVTVTDAATNASNLKSMINNWHKE
ncbi:MAG: leucine-rich repeat protein [Treponemataceae bacterium]|nr:leucine-rich repeat protein [Treponemataceae bacterium]